MKNSLVSAKTKGGVWLLVVLFTALSVQPSFSEKRTVRDTSVTRGTGNEPEEIFIEDNTEYPTGRSRTMSLTKIPLLISHLHRARFEFGEIRIEAVIEKRGALKKATLFYRQEESESFEKIKMKRISGNTYIGTIPVEEISPGGLEYYIEASDKAGNIGSDGSREVPYFSEVGVIGRRAERKEVAKTKKSNWWKWALGAVVVGGAAAFAIASSSDSDSGGSGGNSGSGGSDGSGGTGKITATWK